MGMETFLLAFAGFGIAVLAMAVGAIVSGRRIKGSCGGLNAVAGADKCVVCAKPIDPDSPLRDRLDCPRTRQSVTSRATPPAE
jgi:hypothetical protein